MIYEATIQYISIDKKGNDKTNKEQLIIEDAETFSDVETLLFEQFGNLTSMDTIAIKRSKIKEIANRRENQEDEIFLATLADVFVDEKGVEKTLKYLVAFYAKDIAYAYKFIREYIQQGYNLELVELKITNFVDVV